MSDLTIFQKTPMGEEAVRERTRLVQRNLRMVLIVVDGHIDVAGIKRQVGDPDLVDSALAELEEMGLIQAMEPVGIPAVEADAVAPVAETTAPTVPEEVVPERMVPMPEPEIPAMEPETTFEPEPPPPPEPSPPPKEKKPRQPPLWRRLLDEWRAKRAERAFERAYAEEAPVQESVSPKVQRGRRQPLGWAPRIAMGVAVLILTAVAGILLFPYDSYRPQAEARLGQLLQDVVHVKKMTVTLVPLPAIILTGVEVGEDRYASADKITVHPELAGLWSGRHSYRDIRVSGVRVRDQGIPRIGRWLAGEALRGTSVQRIEVDGLTVDVAGVAVDNLAAAAEMGAHGGLVKWRIRDKEDKLAIEAQPEGRTVLLMATARDWSAPFRAGLVFDYLELQGRLEFGRIELSKLDSQFYGGRLQGGGILSWGAVAAFTADLEYKQVDVARLMAALAGQPPLEGRASGRLRIEARADHLGQLAGGARLEGPFSIAQGALMRIDLANAARAGGGADASLRGGSTKFEQLNGSLVRDDKGVRLSGLQLSAGLMRATGQGAVDREEAITGTGMVELRSSAGSLRTAIRLEGKAADPELRIGR